MEGLPILNLDNGWYVYFLIISEARNKKADR